MVSLRDLIERWMWCTSTLDRKILYDRKKLSQLSQPFSTYSDSSKDLRYTLRVDLSAGALLPPTVDCNMGHALFSDLRKNLRQLPTTHVLLVQVLVTNRNVSLNRAQSCEVLSTFPTVPFRKSIRKSPSWNVDYNCPPLGSPRL